MTSQYMDIDYRIEDIQSTIHLVPISEEVNESKVKRDVHFNNLPRTKKAHPYRNGRYYWHTLVIIALFESMLFLSYRG